VGFGGLGRSLCPLLSIFYLFPKLDVVGSSPISRSTKSATVGRSSNFWLHANDGGQPGPERI